MDAQYDLFQLGPDATDIDIARYTENVNTASRRMETLRTQMDKKLQERDKITTDRNKRVSDLANMNLTQQEITDMNTLKDLKNQIKVTKQNIQTTTKNVLSQNIQNMRNELNAQEVASVMSKASANKTTDESDKIYKEIKSRRKFT